MTVTKEQIEPVATHVVGCFAAEKVVSEQIAHSDSPENIDVDKAFE